MQSVDYLIIGGGIAGTTAAETIRKHDTNGTIVIVSDEAHRLYSRVLLPHYIRGRVMREFVFLKSLEWYEKSSIVLKHERTLARLDAAKHVATLDDGAEYHYRKLLLASGGHVRKLDLPNLHGITYFRTLDDADTIVALANELSACPQAERVACIYGGGFIGLEFAPIFRERGFTTHLAIREKRYWEHYFGEASSAHLEHLLEAQDIHLHRGVDYVRVEGGERLSSVDISGSGKKTTAAVLGLGVGLEPSFAVAAHAGVATGRGIITNEYLETNVPDVYAAGDVAEFFDLTVGRHRILGNWTNAQQHGLCAGVVMTGNRKPFHTVSSYSTSPFGVSITFVGDLSRMPGTEMISRGEGRAGGVGQIFIRDNRVVGATLINMNRERQPLTELIKRNTVIKGFEKQLGDASCDLNTLVR